MEITEVYIVSEYENYGYAKDYKPYKRAFLSKQEVIDFLTEKANEEIKDPKALEEQLSQIEKFMDLDFKRYYGKYGYETEVVPVGQFNY